jgi:NADH:ubiquinone oxidoreductase subunit F (NADH-binding)
MTLTRPIAATRPVTPPATALPRLLPATGSVTAGLDEHLERAGMPPYPNDPGQLIRELRAAGLTGRGGAAFPVHRKLAAVAAAGRPGKRPVVAANAAEGEPASSKDRSLLWCSPHQVLDGLQLAADAVGARRAYVYVNAGPGAGAVRGRPSAGRGARDNSRRLLDRLAGELSARQRAGMDRVPVEIVEAPPVFLAGQETALVNWIGGGPALPTSVPPRVFERGIAGRPTLVQNVETLAHIALIARYGAQWFRAIGTRDEPGSMLCTIWLPDGRPRVVEAALGTPLRELLPLDDRQGTVLTGGYHGAWIPAAGAARMTLTNASLGTAGAFLGAGVLAALPPDRCGLVETARVAAYLAEESAGQCGPCLNGLPLIARTLAALASRRADQRALKNLKRWSGLVEGRGACHHPDGTVRFVRSALSAFADEIGHHLHGRCTATDPAPFLPAGELAGGRR